MLKPFLVATTLTLSTSNAYAQGDRPSTQEEISQYCSQHEDDGNPGVYLILPYKENNFEVLFCNENNDNDTSIFKHDCKSLKRLSEIFQTSWASRSVEIT